MASDTCFAAKTYTACEQATWERAGELSMFWSSISYMRVFSQDVPTAILTDFFDQPGG